jgi:ubiquinone/menaquinone biosynthesis C-methylase UbiE
MSTTETVQSQFSPVAANYRTSVVHSMGAELQKMADLAGQISCPLTLDAGCGAGHTAVALAPVCREVVALDLTVTMLEQVVTLANEKGLGYIRVERGDVAWLPFASATFDIVATRYSAHHWPKIKQALKQCRRVLKPKGLFFMCDIIAPENSAIDTFQQTIEYLRDPSHVRDHRLSEWGQLLADAGFKVRQCDTWTLDLQVERWTQRMATPAAKVAMLKQLMAEASTTIKGELRIRENGWFALPATLIIAQRVS